MHIDLDQLDADAPCDSRFCVIGGGVAGLILARKLASFGFDVTLLGAGGLEF